MTRSWSRSARFRRVRGWALLVGGALFCTLWGVVQWRQHRFDQRLHHILREYVSIRNGDEGLPALGGVAGPRLARLLDDWRGLGPRGVRRMVSYAEQEVDDYWARRRPGWLWERWALWSGAWSRASARLSRRDWALELMGCARLDDVTVERLIDQLLSHPEEEVRWRLVMGLASWGGAVSIAALETLAEDPSARVALVASVGLWIRDRDQAQLLARAQESLAALGYWDIFLGSFGARALPDLKGLAPAALPLIRETEWSPDRLDRLLVYWRMTGDLKTLREELRALHAWVVVALKDSLEGARDSAAALATTTVYAFMSEEAVTAELEALLTAVAAARPHFSLRENARATLQDMRLAHGVLRPLENESPSRGGAAEAREPAAR